MPKFATRGVVVMASQWNENGDHPLDYVEDRAGIENGEMVIITASFRRERRWEGEVVRYFRHPGHYGKDPCAHCHLAFHVHGWIDNGGSGSVVCPGDWVVTEGDGNHYPIKPDVFGVVYRGV